MGRTKFYAEATKTIRVTRIWSKGLHHRRKLVTLHIEGVHVPVTLGEGDRFDLMLKITDQEGNTYDA